MVAAGMPWRCNRRRRVRLPVTGALRAPYCTTTPSPMQGRVGPVALRRRFAPRGAVPAHESVHVLVGLAGHEAPEVPRVTSCLVCRQAVGVCCANATRNL
jgi:hypothetical protein